MLIRACDICKSYPADTYVMHTAKRPDLSGHGYETKEEEKESFMRKHKHILKDKQ